jgi:hypothetical protein
VKLTKCQNHHHHRIVFDTWTKWARPQVELAKGPANRPNTLADWPGFEVVWPMPWLPCIYMRRSLSRWKKSMEAAPPDWPATWLGRPATTWCQTNLSESVEILFTPVNIPLTVKVEITHSTCSSPLVKVLVLARAPEVVSEISELLCPYLSL